MNHRIRTTHSARRPSPAPARDFAAGRGGRLPRAALLGGLALLAAFLLAGAWFSFAPVPVTAQEKPAHTIPRKPGENAKPSDTAKPSENAKPGKTTKPDDAEKPGDGQKP
ncbi:MAG: hypothetical protein ACKOUR_18115, partial [Planctomycetota bacterium]